MPPRTRKTAAAKPKEEAPAVTEADDATVAIAEETDATEGEIGNADPVADGETGDVADADEPKRRGGRKRSELAHAAREFEKWTVLTAKYEHRYASLAEKLSEISDGMGRAREKRDEAKAALDAALNG